MGRHDGPEVDSGREGQVGQGPLVVGLDARSRSSRRPASRSLRRQAQTPAASKRSTSRASSVARGVPGPYPSCNSDASRKDNGDGRRFRQSGPASADAVPAPRGATTMSGPERRAPAPETGAQGPGDAEPSAFVPNTRSRRGPSPGRRRRRRRQHLPAEPNGGRRPVADAMPRRRPGQGADLVPSGSSSAGSARASSRCSAGSSPPTTTRASTSARRWRTCSGSSRGPRSAR